MRREPRSSRAARRDEVLFLRGVEEKLQLHDAEIQKLQKQLGAVDRLQQTFEHQIEILRAAVLEECRRLREGIIHGG